MVKILVNYQYGGAKMKRIIAILLLMMLMVPGFGVKETEARGWFGIGVILNPNIGGSSRGGGSPSEKQVKEYPLPSYEEAKQSDSFILVSGSSGDDSVFYLQDSFVVSGENPLIIKAVVYEYLPNRVEVKEMQFRYELDAEPGEWMVFEKRLVGTNYAMGQKPVYLGESSERICRPIGVKGLLAKALYKEKTGQELINFEKK